MSQRWCKFFQRQTQLMRFLQICVKEPWLVSVKPRVCIVWVSRINICNFYMIANNKWNPCWMIIFPQKLFRSQFLSQYYGNSNWSAQAKIVFRPLEYDFRNSLWPILKYSIGGPLRKMRFFTFVPKILDYIQNSEFFWPNISCRISSVSRASVLWSNGPEFESHCGNIFFFFLKLF